MCSLTSPHCKLNLMVCQASLHYQSCESPLYESIQGMGTSQLQTPPSTVLQMTTESERRDNTVDEEGPDKQYR